MAIIIFNLFGWAWDKTRRANLFLLILTGCSWFILGIWYGIGYCPVTDWHYRVLKSLDNNNLPNSYVKYLIDRITGIDLDPTMVDIAVIIFFWRYALPYTLIFSRAIMRVLQLCHKAPYPPRDGGSIAMNNLTQGLINLGHEVQVLAINTPNNFIDITTLDSN